MPNEGSAIIPQGAGFRAMRGTLRQVQSPAEDLTELPGAVGGIATAFGGIGSSEGPLAVDEVRIPDPDPDTAEELAPDPRGVLA